MWSPSGPHSLPSTATPGRKSPNLAGASPSSNASSGFHPPHSRKAALEPIPNTGRRFRLGRLLVAPPSTVDPRVDRQPRPAAACRPGRDFSANDTFFLGSPPLADAPGPGCYTTGRVTIDARNRNGESWNRPDRKRPGCRASILSHGLLRHGRARAPGSHFLAATDSRTSRRRQSSYIDRPIRRHFKSNGHGTNTGIDHADPPCNIESRICNRSIG